MKNVKERTYMYYHEEGDMLEVCIGKPTSAYFEEIDNGFFERVERKTGERKGFTIRDFKKRLIKLDFHDIPVEEPLLKL